MELGGSLSLSQQLSVYPFPEPLQSSPSSFLQFYSNIVLPSTTRSSKLCLSLRFSHQSPICTYALPDLSPMLRPSYSSWFWHQNDTSWGAQLMKLLIRHPPPFAFYVVSSWHKSFPRNPNLIPLSCALSQGQRRSIALKAKLSWLQPYFCVAWISIQETATAKHKWVFIIKTRLQLIIRL
jgi:hypothetical protein